MVKKKITVKNVSGLHARPANNFVKEAIAWKDCRVSILKDGKSYNGKSIVSVLGACVKCGDEIELIVEGSSEQAALKQLAQAVEAGLGE